jgi:large subunit ribosomal protein L24
VKRLKKGLKVKILVGKDKGKEGAIKVLLPSKNKVVVEGINMYKKHVKPKNDSQGEIIELELPIDASNVAVINDNNAKKKKKTNNGES